MSHSNPLVSVVISSYNSAQYITRCLASLKNQTYSNIEIIFVDSGSTDETKQIISECTDSRLKYFYQDNQPQGVARNYGIEHSTGEYITFLDTDDQFLPEKIAKQVEFFQTHPHYKIVYCGVLHFYTDAPTVLLQKKRRHFPSGDIFSQLLHSSLINPNAVLISRSVFQNKQLLFNEGKEGRYAEEWILFLNLSRAGYQFGCVQENLVLVEMRTNSHTQWNIQWMMKETVLTVFERLFATFSNEQKKRYETDQVLNKHKFKLAVAYLIGKSKKEFLNKVIMLYPNQLVLPMVLFLGVLAPKTLIIRFWKWKQNLSFQRVSE